MASDLLIHATNQGDVEQCQALILEGGANLNYRTVLGETCVHVAVMRSLYGVLEVLLKYGADPNVTQHPKFGGKSPLHVAVEARDIRSAQILLSWSADANLLNVDGAVPLHEAARLGDAAMVRLLLSHGSKAEVKDCYGKTPYYYAQYRHHTDVMALLPVSTYSWRAQRDAEAKNVVYFVKKPEPKVKSKKSGAAKK
eukprot:PhM_4_TR3270/c0_g1_i1/m.106516